MAILPAISIVVLAGLFVALGAAATSKQQSDAQVSFWTQVWRKEIYLFVILPAKLSLDLAKYLAHQMGIHYEAFVEQAIGWLFGLEEAAAYSGIFVYRHAAAFNHFADWLLNDKIPKERDVTSTLAEQKALVKLGKMTPLGAAHRYQVKQAAAALRTAIAAALPGIIAKDFPRLRWTSEQWRKYIGVAAAAGAATLPFPRIGTRTKDRAGQAKTDIGTHKRLHRLEKTLAALGLLSGVSAVTLGEIGRFMRCPNTRGIRKAWCGADLGALLGLLGTLAVIESGFSIVTLAEEMLQIEEDMVKVIGGAFSELHGLV